MIYAARRGTIRHRAACGHSRQFISKSATVSRVLAEYGPIAFSGICFRNSTINGPMPLSAQPFAPSNLACVRAQATKTTGNAPFSIFLAPPSPVGGTVPRYRKHFNGRTCLGMRLAQYFSGRG